MNSAHESWLGKEFKQFGNCEIELVYIIALSGRMKLKLWNWNCEIEIESVPHVYIIANGRMKLSCEGDDLDLVNCS